MKPLTAPPLLLKLFSALPTRAVHCAHINSNVPCRQETTPFTVCLCIFEPHLHFFSRHLTLVQCLAFHTCPPRFLVLCHFRTPGVFTVQAGFHLPGAGSGSIGPAEVDRSSRDLRQPGELVIITADSLEEARGGENGRADEELGEPAQVSDSLPPPTRLLRPGGDWQGQHQPPACSPGGWGCRGTGDRHRDVLCVQGGHEEEL